MAGTQFCPGPMTRRGFLRVGALGLVGGLGLGDLLRLCAASAARIRRGSDALRHVGHLRLAARRAAAHGDVRHEAGRSGGVPRRLHAHPHQRARHRRLRTAAAAREVRGQVHHHPLDRPQLRRPRRRPQAVPDRPRPVRAGRLRQRLPDGRLDRRQAAREHATAGVPNYVCGRRRRPGQRRRVQLRRRVPRAAPYTPFTVAGDPSSAEVRGAEPRPRRRRSPTGCDDRTTLLKGLDRLRRDDRRQRRDGRDGRVQPPGARPADEREGPQRVRPVARARRAARPLRHARAGASAPAGPPAGRGGRAASSRW